MKMFSEVDLLKSENKKLRSYISLILAELELTQRVDEIRQSFPDPADSKRIIMPILDRISKIESEKITFEKDLNLS